MLTKGEIRNMNRKDIFISGFKSKIGYSFTYKDLTEFETVINFYEQQCEKQREVINKCSLLTDAKWTSSSTSCTRTRI